MALAINLVSATVTATGEGTIAILVRLAILDYFKFQFHFFTFVDLIPCQTKTPCQNGATCANSGTGSYQCTCPQGYNGMTCDQEINECLSNPCQLGSTCVVRKHGYIGGDNLHKNGTYLSLYRTCLTTMHVSACLVGLGKTVMSISMSVAQIHASMETAL